MYCHYAIVDIADAAAFIMIAAMPKCARSRVVIAGFLLPHRVLPLTATLIFFARCCLLFHAMLSASRLQRKITSLMLPHISCLFHIMPLFARVATLRHFYCRREVWRAC